MKVALLINSLAGGGAEKQLLLCCAGLARAGFACEVFWLEDRRIHARNEALVEGAQAVGVKFHPPRGRSRLDLRQLFKIRRFLGGSPQAMLWTWGYRADLASLGLLLLARRTKVIGSLRGKIPERTRLLQGLCKIISHTHQAFISNSRLSVTEGGQVAPRLTAKAVVIYNAIEERYFATMRDRRSRPARLRVVMLGNQRTYIKGYDLAMAVAERIKAEGLPIKICIGGAPVEGPALADAIKKRSLSEVLELAGSIDDPWDFLSTGDVFLMLSRSEGTPNALLEAMALGLPAICTRVGDIATIFQNENHLRLIATEAVAAFQAIKELWENWLETQQMAERGQTFCRVHFGEDRMIEATARVLREVGGRNAGQLPP